MNSNVLLLVLLAIFALPTINPTYANEPTLISVTTINSSVIDLNSEEKDRKIHSFAEFENFDLQDGYFLTKIVQTSNGQLIKDFQITVQSTETGLVSFLSQVIFLVNDEMIINNQINPGSYEMIISTIDGTANTVVPFDIIDTRE